MKFEIFYNSYLYPNYYLDTIILDVALVDLTPPTIIFNSPSLTINQNELTSITIETIIDSLLDDISYIDVNNYLSTSSSYLNEYTTNNANISKNYFTISNTNYTYFDISLQESTVNSSIYSQITLDLSHLSKEFLNNITQEFTITYSIRDKANNVNNIDRIIKVKNDLPQPIFRYYSNIEDLNTNNNYINISDNNNFDNITLNIDFGLNNERILELAQNDVAAIDPIENKIIAFHFSFTSDYISVEISYNTIDYVTKNNKKGKFLIYKAYSIADYVNKEIFTVAYRRLKIDDEDIIEKIKPKVCCYPKVYYKPIQHNYKMGSSNSISSRLSQIIVNYNNF
jgi:hypothetical protein